MEIIVIMIIMMVNATLIMMAVMIVVMVRMVMVSINDGNGGGLWRKGTGAINFMAHTHSLAAALGHEKERERGGVEWWKGEEGMGRKRWMVANYVSEWNG